MKRYHWLLISILCLALALWLIVTSDAEAAVRYRLTELPGPATAVSQNGWVVGTTDTSAYRWRDGVLESLPGLKTASGVNSHGDVVGTAHWLGYPISYAASLTPIGLTFYQARVESVAYGINDAGLIVGADTDTFPSPTAWRNTSKMLLGDTVKLSDYWVGEGRAVNNQGWIGGWAGTRDPAYHSADIPVLWKSDKTVLLPRPSGARGARLYALTDSALVGGTYWTGTPLEGTILKPYLQDLWTGQTVTYSTSGVIYGVSDLGWGVGVRHNASGSTSAALYNANGTVVDLSAITPVPAGWTLSAANGVNGSGWIVGTMRRGDEWVGFLLTPIVSPMRYRP